MVDYFVTKPFGLFLIVTAHMVYNDPGLEKVIGIVGKNITLQFKFNVSFTKNNRFAVYMPDEKKIADYSELNSNIEICPEIFSVLYHITNLTQNNSNFYWASLFIDFKPATLSNRVQLIVQEENTSTTVPPKTTSPSTPAGSGSSSFFSSDAVTILVLASMVLLAVILPFLMCCLLKTKDQEQGPQRISNPTLQETIDTSPDAAGPSLIYSVLDFPRRPPTVVEVNPSDTEYAAVSHPPEKRHVPKTDQCKPPDRSLFR